MRWVPRMRKGDPRRTSNVFSIVEMVVVLPRGVFDAVGGWAGEYFYAHEGIELAWAVQGDQPHAAMRGNLEGAITVVQVGHGHHALLFLSSSCTASRSLNFWILPDGVEGMASCTIRRSGMYWTATCCSFRKR